MVNALLSVVVYFVLQVTSRHHFRFGCVSRKRRMIVRQFINWIRTASAGERAEATRALARAWLISDLSHDDRVAAEGALLMLLDDPSPLVRQAMAEALCAQRGCAGRRSCGRCRRTSRRSRCPCSNIRRS